MKERIWLLVAALGLTAVLWALSPSMGFGLTLLALLIAAVCAIFWTDRGKYGKSFGVFAVLLVVIAVLAHPNRHELFMGWRQSAGTLIQDVRATTSEPLPKQVVTQEFKPGEKIRTGVVMKKDQNILIETTALVRMPCSQEPSGFRDIPTRMLQTCLAEGQLILVGGDKPGKVTVTFY